MNEGVRGKVPNHMRCRAESAEKAKQSELANKCGVKW